MTPREARVPRLPLDEAKAAADEAGVPDYMAELAIFQVLLNHPALAGRLNDLLASMLWHGKLDSRLRELAIMRIGWLTASDYEWTQHWRVAQGLGVSADDLLGVRDWQSHNGFGPVERAVLAATDDVVRDGAVSAAELGGVRARVRRRPGDARRAGDRDQRVAHDRIDSAQLAGAAGGRCGELAAGWQTADRIAAQQRVVSAGASD